MKVIFIILVIAVVGYIAFKTGQLLGHKVVKGTKNTGGGAGPSEKKETNETN